MKPPMVKPPSLTARTVRGFVWAFTGSAGQAVLQIAATIVARAAADP
jgi:PST family polysaccharide transporter